MGDVSMMYEKIQTIWKRNPETHAIRPGVYSKEEFMLIPIWEVTEKIDGMNMRVIFQRTDIIKNEETEEETPITSLSFAGRTDKAILPEPLEIKLKELFTKIKLLEVFDMLKSEYVVLYGEGFGPKIQKGGKYRDDQSFILFDILIDGVWLEGTSVTEMAEQLGIQRVPIIGDMFTDDILAYVQSKPESLIGKEDCIMEGVVCRTRPLLLDRFGRRIITKLKVKDIEQYARTVKKSEMKDTEPEL